MFMTRSDEGEEGLLTPETLLPCWSCNQYSGRHLMIMGDGFSIAVMWECKGEELTEELMNGFRATVPHKGEFGNIIITP